jgi:poly(3-hydroxybutyrate) depolymerase
MKPEIRVHTMIAILMLLGGACSGGGTSASTPSSGGALSSGGTTGSGGVSSSGGTVATGGVTGSGGRVGTGGASTTVGTGGHVGTGGTSAGAGGAATGGTISGTGGKGSGGNSVSTGGNTGRDGGATDGRTGVGGITGGSGGTNTGGQATGGGTGASSDPVKSDGCSKTPSLKSGDGLSITVSGTSRTYNLKVPDSYDNTQPYRLMMSYHWMNGTANDVSKGNGTIKSFYGLWDAAGGSTIFVAPQGTSNQWANSGGVDVEFSRQLITLMESEFCIDKSRIFCEGFSMGGSMSYAMACAMPDTIRAVAVHSGGPMSGCVSHTKPVAYFMTHGTKDSVCTYPSYGVPQLQDFAKLDGCTTPDPGLSATAFEAALPEPTSTASACIEFEGCKAGYPVRSCLFVGDHTPSPDGSNGWVPKETWKFISQF